MSQHKRMKRSSLMNAIMAVVLIVAGVAAIAGSLWMQENKINIGVEEYSALQQKLKKPAETETEIITNSEEALPITHDLSNEENNIMEDIPSEEQQRFLEQTLPDTQQEQPAVIVVSPAAAKPLEQDQQEYHTDSINADSGNMTFGFTGANLVACKEANSDFAAWLQIPGTDIDYPVVLTNDVDYYLNHTFTEKKNICGCLFSLGRTDYDAPSQNIAIYGHHMRRSRTTTMFQPLHEYKRASFRDAHATIHLDTLNGSRCYTVFAVINKCESDWDASAADFASADEYQAFLNRAMEWSLYDTGVSVTTEDHILTLITCDRDYNSEDGQLVVMAVQQ